MVLPIWLHLCTIWYIGSNALIAYRCWSALPTFFAICYSTGLFGGLGDHLEPYVPVEYHQYTTHIMENYIGRFPLALSIVAILLRFCTLGSLGFGKKLQTLGLMAIPLIVLMLHHPGDYNTDWQWHLVHSVVVHGCLLASNLQIFNYIVGEQKMREKSA